MIDNNRVASPVSVSGQQSYDGTTFPLVLACEDSALGLDETIVWVASRRQELLDASAASGAVLFRGFPLRTAEDFDRFIAAFELPNFPYDESLSNAVRINRTARVFTANEAPPTTTILLHHEMAQTPVYPSRLFFFCEQAADAGGATPLCRSDVLWRRLAEQYGDFARDCREKGLCYTNVMPTENDANSGMGRGWQSTLRAGSRDEAERRLAQLGYRWEWLDDGCLRATTPVLAAVRRLDGQRETFFNQLIAAYHGWKDTRNDPSKSVTFGDGTPLSREAMAAAAELAEALTFDLAWQTGDVALVDNFVTMHGRRPFRGTRKVLASLVACTEG